LTRVSRNPKTFENLTRKLGNYLDLVQHRVRQRAAVYAVDAVNNANAKRTGKMVKTLTGKTFTLEVEDISRNSDRTPGTAGSTEEEAGAGTASSGGTGDGYFQSYEDFDVSLLWKSC